MRLTIVLIVLAILSPVAAAGTAEDPEVVDPAGDCSFPPGNHYMDLVAAWISEETEDGFMVNMQLSEWIEPVGNGAGFTIQFTHQSVSYGVIAAYFGSWQYANGRVSEDAEVEGWNTTTGSFAASPPVISVLFHKEHFPHTEAMDHQLVDFWGGSIDLKPIFPFFILPAELPLYPPPLECDTVTGTRPYVFQTGAHSMGAMGGNETMDHSQHNMTVAANSTATPASAPTQSPSDAKGVPGAGLVVAASAIALAALALRRR